MAAGVGTTATLNLAINATPATQAAAALSQLEAAALRAEQAFTRIGTAANRAAVGHNNVRVSTGQLAAQMTNLQAQMFDVATTIQQAGPFNVLMQQGPQVYQALNGPGGVSQGIRNVREALVAAVTPGRLLGVALAGAAGVALVAWNRYGDAQREVLRTLEGQGRGLGITASAFESMSQRMAAAGQLSIAAARDLGNELARTGSGISTTSIERIARVSKDFSATYTQGDLQAGVTKLTSLISSGAEGIAAWGKRQELYNTSQRAAIEQAVRLQDVNKAIDITLDAMNGKLAKYNDTTSPLVKAWEDIKRSISDIITTFGPYIDKFATATASVFGLAAQGAKNIASGDISDTAPVRGLRKIQNFIETGNPNEAYQSGDISRAHADNANAVEKAASANDKLATALKNVAEAQRNGATSVDENSARLRDQQSVLLNTQKALRETLAEGGGTISEQSAVAEKLVKIRDALDSTDAAARQAAIGFSGLSNAEVKSAMSTDERVAAAKGEEEARKRLGNAVEDQTQKVVRENETYKDRDAQVKKFEEATRNRISLTKEQAEASDRVVQALKSETNADGTRMTQAQKAKEQDDIALESIRARTTEERAGVALRQTIAQQRGQEITGNQALQQQIAAVTRAREEDRMRVVDMIQDQDMAAERIKVERDLLFSSAEARAQVIAKLEQEQALRRQGISTTTPEAQALMGKAATNATDKLFNDTLIKGVSDAKRSVSDFAVSFATDMSNGVKAADALANALKKVGQSLIQGGISQAVQGLATGNMAQAGIGAAEAGVGFLLNAFGPSEKSKQRKQQMMDAWAKQQQDDFDAIQKQQQAVIDAGIASARASQQAAEEATRKAEDAQRRIEGFQDRAFVAGIDTSSFEGQLAVFERQAQRERELEVRNGGEALVELERAQAAEREKIVRDNIDALIVEEKRRFDEAKAFLDQFARSIAAFVSGLRTGAQSPLAPDARLAAAQAAYDAQLAAAQGGDRDAASNITNSASVLLDAARAMYASSTAYQNVFNTVTSQLDALPSQVSPEQFIVNAIDDQTNTLSGLFAALDTNGDEMISRQEAANSWLASVFDELDTNGDGQISRLELIKGATESTNLNVDTTIGQNVTSNNLLDAVAINTQQLATIQQQLQTIFNTTAKTSNNAARTASNTMYSANKDTASNIGTPGDFTYAGGGWVYGPGGGTSDSIRAWLSNGEYVVRAQAANALRPYMDTINQGRLPSSNDNNAAMGALLVEIRTLRAEIATLRTENTRAIAAAAEYDREGMGQLTETMYELVRETKRSNAA